MTLPALIRLFSRYIKNELINRYSKYCAIKSKETYCELSCEQAGCTLSESPSRISYINESFRSCDNAHALLDRLLAESPFHKIYICMV